MGIGCGETHEILLKAHFCASLRRENGAHSTCRNCFWLLPREAKDLARDLTGKSPKGQLGKYRTHLREFQEHILSQGESLAICTKLRFQLEKLAFLDRGTLNLEM